jgi:hypothetical protein
MVPIGYTVEEFIDYLRFEVLRESADALGWGNLIDRVVPLPEVKTVSASTTTTITVSALANAVASNSLIIFEDGYARTTQGDVAAAGTVLTLQEPIVDNAPDGKKVLIIYAPYTERVQNPKYVYVVDEALRQMGLENIEQINASNIIEFRLRGRLELLRRITESRVTLSDRDINWADNSGTSTIQRIQSTKPFTISQQLFALYDRETKALSDELAAAQVVVVTPTPTFNVPDEANSSSTEITVGW